MKHIALLSAAVFAVAASPAFAAEEVDVTVSGIIRPATCAMTVGNGGDFDHGEINSALLGTENRMEAISTPFSVECSSAARWALKAADGRTGHSGPTNAFGLGKTVGDVQIGSYVLSIVDGVADTSNMIATVSTDNAATWSASVAGNANELSYGPTRMVGFNIAGADAQGPKVIKSFAGKLNVQASINDVATFNLSEAIELDGASTIELHML